MKVLVLGNGFIAAHLNYEILDARVFPDREYIFNLLSYHKPDVIINCMGYCGVKNIDDCELNKERTLESNLTIPTMLAAECNKLGIRMVHIGSGCIFYGRSPNSIRDPNSKLIIGDAFVDHGWKETDNPKLESASFYSKIKYACDLAVGNLPNTCILRIRMPISYKNSPRNLINKLLKYENVLEAPNSVTFLMDLTRAIEWAIENNKTGVYHVTNPTPMTHVQLLEEYRKYVPSHKYNVINEEQLQNFITAPRSNCLLNTDKLTAEGFSMTPTLDALKECMDRYVRN
jgi:3,5-epimerase/4-reductase